MQAKIPTKDLDIDIKLEVGNRVSLSSGLEATVAEMTDEYIVIDANGPMAGKTLNFDVELVDLVKVSPPVAHSDMAKQAIETLYHLAHKGLQPEKSRTQMLMTLTTLAG